MTQRTHTALSYLEAPVDVLLGKQSHVRILRVLTEYEHPIPPVEVARATRLDLTGVARALETLAATGIVRTIGVGRGRVLQFNPAHPLAPLVQQLFDGERQQRQALLDALQQAVEACEPPPRSAWISGPHATGQDTMQDALQVGVLVHGRERQQIATALEAPLRQIEQTWGLTIDLTLHTQADLHTLSAAEAEALGTVILVYGIPPIHFTDAAPRASHDASHDASYEASHGASPGASHPARTHAALDHASLQAALGVARAITRDPRIIERAQRWVTRRLPNASEAERHTLREWAHILTMPPHQIAALLMDPGARATRLRQSSPFRAVTGARSAPQGVP
jgi:DNA-binding IclR family transcriptional regulator